MDLHQKALMKVRAYKKSLGELIEVLMEIDRKKIYLKMGYSSLFVYITKSLALSESQAYNLSAVLRKSHKIPELKKEMIKGALPLTKAKRLISVLSEENTKEENQNWVELAKILTQRQLEKEIAKVKPKTSTPDRVSYVTDERMKLELGVSEKLLIKLRRVQDLVSQSTKKSASLEDCLEIMVNEYLNRKDPLIIAKRAVARKRSPKNSNQIQTENRKSTGNPKPNLNRKLTREFKMKENRKLTGNQKLNQSVSLGF